MGIALVFVAAAAAVVLHRTGGDGPRFAHPDEWDERVVDLVEFVEDARGLRFDHPVFVDFLSVDDYRAAATADAADLTDDDRDALLRDVAVLRALGLATGEVDLFEAVNTVVDGSTLAFYDTDDGRIRVRGTELTVGVRVTLVHELTHALQDQAFDLRRVHDNRLEDAERLSLRGIVEGDAMRIETRYVDQVLDDAARAAYEAERRADAASSEEATAEVPGYLTASFATPYVLGAPFVALLDASGGNGAVDAALRDPPTTDEHLFDPVSHLADQGAEALELDLGDVEVHEDGFFGPAAWYLVLAERIDPFAALDAALGWGGDAYAVFERDGATCVRAAFAGDAPDDEVELADALEAWVAALGHDRARTLEVDGRPGFEACDPGPDAEVELTERTRDALALPSVRAYLVAAAAGFAPRDADAASCFAGAVLETLRWEDVVDPSGAAFAGDDFQRQMLDAMLACA